MVESIKELRSICVRTKIIQYSFIRIRRFFSIYITWLFLHFPRITANHATILSLISYLLTGVFFAFGNENTYWFVILAIVAKFLGDLFDCVDGEIARYRKSFTPAGRFADELIHIISKPFIFLGIGLYVFNLTGNIIYLLLGALAVVFSDMMEMLILYRTEIRYENQHLLNEEVLVDDKEKKLSLIQRAHKFLLEIYIAIQFQILYGFAILQAFYPYSMAIFLWIAALFPIILIAARIFNDLRNNMGIPLER